MWRLVPAGCAERSTSRAWRSGQSSHQQQRIDAEVRRVERRGDRRWEVRIVSSFPEIDLVGEIQPLSLTIEDDAHLRPVRFGRGHFDDNRDFAGIQLDEIAGGIDPNQLREAAYE